MIWRLILFLWHGLKWWIGAALVGAGAIYYGPKKIMETWIWYKKQFYNWRYGEFRPSRNQINRMSGDEYIKHFYDPKFRKWVDRLFPNSDEPPVDGPGRL